MEFGLLFQLNFQVIEFDKMRLENYYLLNLLLFYILNILLW